MSPAFAAYGVSRRKFLALATALATLGTPFAAAQADASRFPERPITLMVPWPAGGGTDRHFRVLGNIVSEYLGQSIIIENKPGAGGTLGPGSMALSAKPDGYTLAQYPMSMLRMPLMNKVQWDPVEDFSFVIGLTGYTFGITVRADSPFQTFDDYIEAARQKPEAINYGHTGRGTTPHLFMERIATSAKVKLSDIGFKGNAEVVQAVMGGHIMALADASGWDQLVDSGKMRLLATLGENRTKRWPDVPTVKELGYEVVSSSPYGIVGPKGMDPAIIKTLHDAFRKAMDDPRHVQVMEQLNQEIWYKNSEDYEAFVRAAQKEETELITRLGLAQQ